MLRILLITTNMFQTNVIIIKSASLAIVSARNMVWRNLCLPARKQNLIKKTWNINGGNSWKAKLKYNVDRAIWSSVSFDEFMMKMTESGYEIRKGQYLTFRAPKQKHFTNVKTLGAYYAEDSILRRLEKNRHKARIPQNAPFKVRTFIQMISYVADGNRTGFDQWAKKNNLKEAAKTFSKRGWQFKIRK